MLPKEARGTFKKHVTKRLEQVAAPPSTVAAVSIQQQAEHFKNALQNITTEGTTHSVHFMKKKFQKNYVASLVTLLDDSIQRQSSDTFVTARGIAPASIMARTASA